MRWYQIYDILDCGGMVRRKGWGSEKYIRTADSQDIGNPLYLIDENEQYIELTEEELRATDWEEYTPVAPSDDALSDEQYAYVVRERCRAKMNHKQRTLRNRLQLLAERNRSVPNWEIKSGQKYFIVYSELCNGYRVEAAYSEYSPHEVYFATKEACATAIRAYKPLLDTARMLNHQFNLLCTQEYDRETLKAINYVIISV